MRATDLSIEHLAATSAILNGVLIPGRQIEATIARYAFNVFVANNDVTFPVSLRGTGTAIRFGGHELLVCTQHQLEGVDRQKVGMMADGGALLVTSGGTRHYTPTGETDAYDLVAFNFTEPVVAHPQFRSRFFNLGAPATSRTETIGYLVSGCAYEDQSYLLEADDHIGVARRTLVCHAAEKQPTDDALLNLRAIEPLSFNPDGMSGGSSFVVYDDRGILRIDFAGIVVRGGTSGFHIVKAGTVRGFLKSCAWPA